MAPIITSFSPVDNATNVAPDANLILTFDQAVLINAGQIEILKVLPTPFGGIETQVALIDVTDNNQVSLSPDGRTATINPAIDLSEAGYVIRLTEGAFRNVLGEPVAGINDKTTWNFATTTGSTPPPPDTTAPNAPVIQSAPSALGNDPTPTWAGTAEPGSTIGLFQGNQLLKSATADATTGNWQITADALLDGSYTFSFTATDAASNVSASSAFTMQIDATKPTVSLSSLASNPTHQPFTVTASFSEVVVGFTIDDLIGNNGKITNFQAIDSKTYTFSVEPLQAGDVTISVNQDAASDAAGNTSLLAQLTRQFDPTLFPPDSMPPLPPPDSVPPPPTDFTTPPAPTPAPTSPLPPSKPGFDPITGAITLTDALLDFGENLDNLTNFKLRQGTPKADTLKGTNTHDALRGRGRTDRIFGRGGNDFLAGGNQNDQVEGNVGNDYILGGSGDDVLNGGIGNDVLVGKLGRDTLMGGAGSDQFVFSSPADRADAISDFKAGSDLIVVSARQFNGELTAGLLNDEQLVLGMKARDADDRFLYHKRTGTLLFDADGNGSDKALELAQLKPGTNLSSQSISVI